MFRLNCLRLLQALLLCGLAVFALGFSHLTLSQTLTAGMERTPNHSGSALHCQILCTTAIKTEDQGILANLENRANYPLPVVAFLSTFSLSLLAVTFIVKLLYALSSWRPPDRILLCGHFADGL